MNPACYHWATETSSCKVQNLLIYKVCMKMGTFLVLDIPKVPSDSTIWELCKSVFGIFGIKNLSRLDSRDMWIFSSSLHHSYRNYFFFTKYVHVCVLKLDYFVNLLLCKLKYEWKIWMKRDTQWKTQCSNFQTSVSKSFLIFYTKYVA